jgi:tubulin-specific chaperone E
MRSTQLVHRFVDSSNRLQPPSKLKLGTDAFSRLTELQLNGTLMSWQSIMDVITLMPHLQRLDSGYNHLQNLLSVPQGGPEPHLTSLNFDSNQLSDWAETCQALTSFPKCFSYRLESYPFR